MEHLKFLPNQNRIIHSTSNNATKRSFTQEYKSFLTAYFFSVCFLFRFDCFATGIGSFCIRRSEDPQPLIIKKSKRGYYKPVIKSDSRKGDWEALSKYGREKQMGQRIV